MIEPVEPWPDDLADVVAIVTAIREDRTADVAVVLRHTNLCASLITACKLLAVAAEEGQASPEHLRNWAAQAIGRP